jgi:tRNA1Val (adenine37-N6)-methyltransferase
MGNQSFKFKQFSIYQDRCAMKVGTDGVALGAWAPVTDVRRILDIGTGTGLVALMLAQRSAPDCQIVAVELDEAAAVQAAENVQGSPWSQRVRVQQGSIQQFEDEPFDLIVSNPPYFRHGQSFSSSSRQQARHTSTLTHDELLSHALRLLSPAGHIALILPVSEAEFVMALAAEKRLHVVCCQRLIPKPGKVPNRFLLLLSRINHCIDADDIVICSNDGQYAERYRTLVEAFYLKL